MSYNNDYPPPRRDDPYLEPARPRDLRRRVPSSPHPSPPPDYDDYDDRQGSEPPDEGPPQGCMGLSRRDWLFVVVLLFAAMRGASDQKGCLPSRGCLNAILFNLVAIAALVAAAFTAQDNSSLATVLAGAGSLMCVVGLGSIVLLIWAALRLIDFSGIDDGGALDSSGGIIENILGRR